MMMMMMMGALKDKAKQISCGELCYLSKVECFIQQDNDNKMSSQTANTQMEAISRDLWPLPFLCVFRQALLVAIRDTRSVPAVFQQWLKVARMSECTNFMVKQMERNDSSCNPAHWLSESVSEWVSEWVCVMQWPLQVGTLTFRCPHHALVCVSLVKYTLFPRSRSEPHDSLFQCLYYQPGPAAISETSDNQN